MTDMIDIHGLPEEDVRFIRDFVEFLRQKTKKSEAKVKGKEEIPFADWPLGVKGKLTREEIYDYL